MPTPDTPLAQAIDAARRACADHRYPVQELTLEAALQQPKAGQLAAAQTVLAWWRAHAMANAASDAKRIQAMAGPMGVLASRVNTEGASK